MPRYVPALGVPSPPWLYDAVVGLTLPEQRFKADLVAQAELEPGHRVLDLGCGTGTLTRLVAPRVPGGRAVGLDGDMALLRRARAKAAPVPGLTWVHGLAEALPFPPGSFDRVLSTLVFHHLTDGQKQRALAQVHALLAPGGELHLADWGLPQDGWMRLAYYTVQLVDGFETTRGNVAGCLVPMMREAGFQQAAVTGQRRTLFGTLQFHRAVR